MAVAVWVGPYLVLDALLLSFTALMVALYAFWKVEPSPSSGSTKPIIRSRVYRFSKMAGKGEEHFVLGSESAALRMPELGALPESELEDLDEALRRSRDAT